MAVRSALLLRALGFPTGLCAKQASSSNTAATRFMKRTRILLLALPVLFGVHVLGATESQRPTNRTASLKALCQQLNVGAGSVIADVGCGDGPDTLVFATIVGDRGTVLAQEIDTAKLEKVVKLTGERGLHQVVPVLGETEDPRLPDGSADLIYMNRVFHHFARPQAMLERMWFDLKPGGFLVVVDQQKGPLTDWTPTDSREKKHHWTGETTVVRLAREAGFLFHDSLDGLWHEEQPFVLAFRKPLKAARPDGDPDLPRPLDVKDLVRRLPMSERDENLSVVFFGLDRGRAVLPELRAQLPTATRLFDVVIDEWALSQEELPPEGRLSGVEISRTEKSGLVVPQSNRVGLVLFVDAYHRLWKPLPRLEQIKNQLSGSGLIAVVERKGPDGEARHLAGHRRRLSSALVIEDMRQAGFQLRQTLSAPARDRYYLLFELPSSAVRKPGSGDTRNSDSDK
jgi:ubiquinone/menaquinone biosynthesis C-methylase UbiE